MTRDLLVGIDAGTSVIKSVAFTAAGIQVASFAIPNSYTTGVDGSSEQDMARTWTNAAAALRGLKTHIPDLAERIAAIAVTGQGDGTWLIDADGLPVLPAWLWLDARAADIVDALRAGPANDTLYASTGTGLAACQMGGQLIYIDRTMPDALARATTAFHCKDWLYFKLTGERATDPSEGNFTFGDYRTRTYADQVVETLGLGAHRRLLPPIVDGTLHQHRLSAAAAAETGLPEGIPVVLGYVDVICTALGGGLYDPSGEAGLSIVGSTGMHMRFAPDAASVRGNADRTGYTMPFPVPGAYAQMQSNMAATLNIDWLVELARDGLSMMGEEHAKKDVLLALDARLAEAAPGVSLYHPYISDAGERGPFIDATARASLIGLGMRHGFAELGRAVYEGLAFAARDCYAAMGPIPKEIRLSGGAARSRTLRRIIASVLGTDLRTSSQEEAGAAGAAMIAAVGLGLYPSMAACVGEWVTPKLGEAERPDPYLAGIYDRLFPSYVASRQALSPVWRAMRPASE